MARGRVLEFWEREEIVVGIARGWSAVAIADRLGRHSSVVAREIARNGGRQGYRAVSAQERADEQRARPRARKLEANSRLLAKVNEGLARRWSPQQIADRLREEFPDDPNMWISHEAIYSAFFAEASGAFRMKLSGALRTKITRRRSRRERRRLTEAKSQVIPNMVMISERAPEAAGRQVAGHWEGDLIVGSRNQSAIATLVDRHSRYTLLVKLNYDHTADRVASMLIRTMNRLPQIICRSLTWDQGREMAKHRQFTKATGIPVYFCEPHSPWQRPTNENTNGLLREYFPKGTDLSIYSQADLDTVAAELNDRPRRVLDRKKPIEVLNATLAQHGYALTV